MAVTVASSAQVANWFTTTSPQTVGGLAWSTGDVVIVFGTAETATQTLATPTNANLTFSLRTSITTGGANECPAYLWSAVAGTSQWRQDRRRALVVRGPIMSCVARLAIFAWQRPHIGAPLRVL